MQFYRDTLNILEETNNRQTQQRHNSQISGWRQHVKNRRDRRECWNRLVQTALSSPSLHAGVVHRDRMDMCVCVCVHEHKRQQERLTPEGLEIEPLNHYRPVINTHLELLPNLYKIFYFITSGHRCDERFSPPLSLLLSFHTASKNRNTFISSSSVAIKCFDTLRQQRSHQRQLSFQGPNWRSLARNEKPSFVHLCLKSSTQCFKND